MVTMANGYANHNSLLFFWCLFLRVYMFLSASISLYHAVCMLCMLVFCVCMFLFALVLLVLLQFMSCGDNGHANYKSLLFAVAIRVGH